MVPDSRSRYRQQLAFEQLYRQRVNRFERSATIPLKDLLNSSLQDAARGDSDGSSSSGDISDVYEELAKSEQIVAGRVVVDYSPDRASRSRSRSAAATPTQPTTKHPLSDPRPSSQAARSAGGRRARFADDGGSDSDGFLDFVLELNRRTPSASKRAASPQEEAERRYRAVLRDIYGDQGFHVLAHHAHRSSPAASAPPHASPSPHYPRSRSPLPHHASPLPLGTEPFLRSGERSPPPPSPVLGFPSAAEALSFAATGYPAPSPARGDGLSVPPLRPPTPPAEPPEPPRASPREASREAPRGSSRSPAPPDVGAALDDIRREVAALASLVQERRASAAASPLREASRRETWAEGPERPLTPRTPPVRPAPWSAPRSGPRSAGRGGRQSEGGSWRRGPEGDGEERAARWLEHAERHVAASEERLRRALQRRLDDEARRAAERWRQLEAQVRSSAGEAAAAWRAGRGAAASVEQLEASNRALRAELARLQSAIARGGRPRMSAPALAHAYVQRRHSGGPRTPRAARPLASGHARPGSVGRARPAARPPSFRSDSERERGPLAPLPPTPWY